jgi:hypothetical protein
MANYYEQERQVMLEKVKSVEENYHELSKGEELEEILKTFLVKNLPATCGIGTGFVIDTFSETTSKQIDIIIYHKPFTVPIKNYDTFQVYAVENVIAAISVKKRLRRKSQLYTPKTGHIDNIASVKQKIKNIHGQSVYPPIGIAFTYLYDGSLINTAEEIIAKGIAAEPTFLNTGEQYILNALTGEPTFQQTTYLPDLFCFLNKGIIIPRPQWRFMMQNRRPVAMENDTLKNFFFVLLSMIEERMDRSYQANMWAYAKRV